MISGILLLDKAKGITSNKALQQVKYLYGKDTKAGHTGSLDPIATGMLPICLGKSTKIAGNLLNADKTYVVTAQFGIKTTTGDVDGIIKERQALIAKVFNNLTVQQINMVIKNFIGETWQTPPVYSAIKQNGVRLYKIARENNDLNNITVPPRLITIYSIELVNICYQKQQIILKVYCGKGTYIRSLVEDIARELGYLATVFNLRRTAVGNWHESKMISFSELTNKTKEELISILI